MPGTRVVRRYASGEEHGSVPSPLSITRSSGLGTGMDVCRWTICMALTSLRRLWGSPWYLRYSPKGSCWTMAVPSGLPYRRSPNVRSALYVAIRTFAGTQRHVAKTGPATRLSNMPLIWCNSICSRRDTVDGVDDGSAWIDEGRGTFSLALATRRMLMERCACEPTNRASTTSKPKREWSPSSAYWPSICTGSCGPAGTPTWNFAKNKHQ
jgi:hypothetical protein